MNCRKCGKEITKQKFCSKECRESWYFNEYRLAKGIKVGTGSGALVGKANHRYKHGLGMVVNGINRLMKQTVRYCERCGKDLMDAAHYEWCVHHKDHDRTNNVKENLQLLCKSCHQIHHEVWRNFEGAETIRKE